MDISTLRQRIDDIDARLLELLTERAQISLEIGEHKRGENQSISNPEREQKILARLLECNRGPLTPDMVRAIYRVIIRSCRDLQHRQV